MTIAPMNASFIARRSNRRATKRTITKIATTKIKPIAVEIMENKLGWNETKLNR